MRNTVLSLVILTATLVPGSIRAQDGFQLESLLVSSGSTPITSGVAGIARFRNSNGRFAEVAAQSEQAWISYGQYFEKGNLTFLAAGAVAHFQTAPLLGLRLDANIQLTQRVRFYAMYWPGIVLEEPEDWKTENDGVENPESVLHGQFGGVGLAIGPVQLSYHMLNFLDDPWNELPGVSYSWPVQDDLALSLSATWNNNSQDWLPWIGVVWSP